MCIRDSLCLIAFLAAPSLYGAEEYTWWIDPCTPALAKSTACETDDASLGRWALEAWQRESSSAIVFKRSPTEEDARIRIHWAGGTDSLYGETKPIFVAAYFTGSHADEREQSATLAAVARIVARHLSPQ